MYWCRILTKFSAQNISRRKKMHKKLSKTCIALVCALSLALGACGTGGNSGSSGSSGSAVGDDKAVKISYYDETSFTENGAVSVMGEDLFRRNQFDLAIADPSIIRITDFTSEDEGMYYLYGTVGASASLVSFKSSDLTDWKYVGIGYLPDTATELGQATASLIWAPEVVYDESDGYYYAFFSASEAGKRISLSYCARSQNPGGPFEIVSNAASESRTGDYTQTIGDKYSLLNYAELSEWFLSIGGTISSTYDNHIRATIDFHPFEDPISGKKYLYFKIQEAYKGRDALVGVEVESWTKPNYDTLTLLGVAGYSDTSCTTLNEYESDAKVNEGMFVNYRNGIYYLTFSAYGYSDVKYAVLQAYSKHPLGWTNGVKPENSLGDFRKLQADEGGVLISTDKGGRYGVYATGHHAFIDIDGKTYAVYHAYQTNDFENDVRYLMVDEVKWLDIKDKDGKDLTVMYVNGPTTNVMPKFDFASDYKNLAVDASITATSVASASSAKWLNDDLYKIGVTSNAAFTEKYVQEARFSGSTDITVDLGGYKTVRSVMVFNSNDYDSAFRGVKKITMDCKLASGKTFTAEIDDLKFDMDNNINPEIADSFMEILPGAAAVAEFDEMLVKSIKITVEKPSDNDELAISEVVVLGKNDDSAKATATAVSNYTDKYEPKTSTIQKGLDYALSDGIELDGALDEAVWANQVWAEYRKSNAAEGADYTVKMTSYLGESGVYFAFKVTDDSVYDNPRTPTFNCSSIELYLSRADVDKTDGNAFCCTVTAGGRYTFRKWIGSGFSAWFSDGKAPYAAVKLDGTLNKENGSNGYTIELYMDYAHLGLSSKPEQVAASLLLNGQYTKDCIGRNRFHVIFGNDYVMTNGWTRTNPSTWTKWGGNGLIELIDSEVY